MIHAIRGSGIIPSLNPIGLPGERSLTRHRWAGWRMRTPTRLLPLAGAYNFRDLGGYPTSEGRQTRWNILFRSDTLHEVTPMT